jgi:hypothetical protein
MNTNYSRTAILAVLWIAAVPALAQKTKTPSLPPGNLFFTLKGQPFALERLIPGIQAALLLSDVQKRKLTEALEQTILSEPVRSAGRTLKADPNAAEARKVVEAAHARLQEQVAGTLTQEQKNLIIRINAAAAEAHINARKKLEIEFTADKTDKSRQDELNREMRKEAQAELSNMLMAILSADQRDAMEKAAQQQRAAEEAAAKKGKP